MRNLILYAFAALLFASSTAVACICDITCHPGEVYSDEEELCVPIEDKKEQAATS